MKVPDYYDVVLSPMDLETMRAKIDAHLYPTYEHFLYDIEQILYNAKLYNPTDGSSRGKSIISAANQMVDAIESHAFHNIQIMKYNVFKKCEEAYYQRYFIAPPPPKTLPQRSKTAITDTTRPNTRRSSLRHTTTSQQEKPSPPRPKKKAKVIYDSRGSNAVSDINYLKQHRNQMPSENFEFYEYVLERHQEVAEEIEEQNRLEREEAEQEEEEEGDQEEQQEKQKGGSSSREHRLKVTSTNTRACGRHRKEEEGGLQEDEEEDEQQGQQDKEEKDEQDEKENGTNNAEATTSIPPTLVVDLAMCPLMKALRLAATKAHQQEQEGAFQLLMHTCVRNTEGWSVSQLIALYSSK